MRRFLLIPVLVFCLLAGAGVNAAAGANGNGSGISGQLKIFRAALYMPGAEEQIRLEAAAELLRSREKEARKILLEALEQSENLTTRQMVCKSLSQSRGWWEPIRDKGDFVDPLLNILVKGSGVDAKLAAEATLVFEYKRISRQLKRIISDEGYETPARLNAIYALQLRPNKEAIFELIKLLDSLDGAVASSAASSLQESLGIPPNL